MSYPYTPITTVTSLGSTLSSLNSSFSAFSAALQTAGLALGGMGVISGVVLSTGTFPLVSLTTGQIINVDGTIQTVAAQNNVTVTSQAANAVSYLYLDVDGLIVQFNTVQSGLFPLYQVTVNGSGNGLTLSDLRVTPTRSLGSTTLVATSAGAAYDISQNGTGGAADFSIDTGDAAASERATLKLTTTGTSAANDYILTGYQGATRVFSVDRLGAGTFSGTLTVNKTAQTGVGETLASFAVTDDATAKVEIINMTGSNTAFTPGIRGTTNAVASSFWLMGAITTDTGTAPAVVFDSRLGPSTAIATRPLFAFANLGVTLSSVSAKGAWAYTVTHVNAASETLATWALDEDTTSTLGFYNNTLTNAFFVPEIRGNQSTTATGLVLTGQITTDTGTAPAMLFNARIGAATNVATRPLFDFRNNGTSKMAMAANGAITYVVTSAATTAESLASWALSDDATAKIEFINGSATDALFLPVIQGTGSGSNIALFTASVGTTDSGANPVCAWNARIGASTAVATRPIYEWRNNNVVKMQMAANGAVTHTVTAAASVGETLSTWVVSDDATGKFEITNGTSTDANFIPTLRSTVAGTQTGLSLLSHITTDTGSSPGMLLRSAITGSAVLTTRPLFDFQNYTTSVLQLVPLNSGANAAFVFNASGLGAPAFTTRSNGTKLVLLAGVDASHVDWGFGMESGAMYASIRDGSSTNSFKFYGGTSVVTTIRGDGLLDNLGTIRAQDWAPLAAGAGLELCYGYTSNTGLIKSYDRTGSAFKDLHIEGLTVALRPSGTAVLTASASAITATQVITGVQPSGIGTSAAANKVPVLDANGRLPGTLVLTPRTISASGAAMLAGDYGVFKMTGLGSHTLPATPANGSQIGLRDGSGNWATYKQTFTAGGSDKIGPGTDTTLECSANDASIMLIYDANNTTWWIL